LPWRDRRRLCLQYGIVAAQTEALVALKAAIAQIKDTSPAEVITAIAV
jgi:hypothetical protein